MRTPEGPPPAVYQYSRTQDPQRCVSRIRKYKALIVSAKLGVSLGTKTMAGEDVHGTSWAGPHSQAGHTSLHLWTAQGHQDRHQTNDKDIMIIGIVNAYKVSRRKCVGDNK